MTLKRIMRAAGDPAFASFRKILRSTEEETAIPLSFYKSLKAVSESDVRNDPSWMFAPIAVLSHVERDSLNLIQLKAFATIRSFANPW